jgi:hypothetical protein
MIVNKHITLKSELLGLSFIAAVAIPALILIGIIGITTTIVSQKK